MNLGKIATLRPGSPVELLADAVGVRWQAPRPEHEGSVWERDGGPARFYDGVLGSVDLGRPISLANGHALTFHLPEAYRAQRPDRVALCTFADNSFELLQCVAPPTGGNASAHSHGSC